MRPCVGLSKKRVEIPAAQAVGYSTARECRIFVCVMEDTLSDKRHVSVTGRRMKVDRAVQIMELLDVHHRSPGKITVVMDDLNTHMRPPYMRLSSRMKRVVSLTVLRFIIPQSMAVGPIWQRLS